MSIEAPSFWDISVWLRQSGLIAPIKGVATPEEHLLALPCGSWGSTQTKKRSSEQLAWDEATSGDSCGNYGKSRSYLFLTSANKRPRRSGREMLKRVV